MIPTVNQDYKFKFVTAQGTHDFINAPIGYEVLVQSLERSRESDAIVLNITTNLQYIKHEKDFLVNLRRTEKLDFVCEVIIEQKDFNTYEIIGRGFLDLKTLHIEKNVASISYTDNPFDKVLRSNFTEKFEYGRTTSIAGEDIPVPFVSQMLWKNRNIFLRSVLDSREPYEEKVGISALTPYISMPLTKIISSDEHVVNTFPHSDQTYFVGYNVGDTSQVFPQAQQYFYLNNDRYKVLNIGFELSLTLEFAPSTSGSENQFVHVILQKSFQEENGSFTNVQLYTITVLNGDGNTGPQLLEFSSGDFPIPFELEQGECFSLVYLLPQNINNELKYITPLKNEIIITEDSFFEPEDETEIYVDCITLYDAFKRVVEIMDPSVVFKSDFITNNWAGVVVFSGETARHILYDGVKAVLGTFSFEMLFEFLFTLQPCSFGIRYDVGVTTLEIEDIGYFFGDEKAIHLGTLEGIVRTTNEDKVFSRIEIGYRNSGKNEEVFGLQATHTVNVYSLPTTTEFNTYEATTEIRTDPNELELCYRKQYTLFPDTDTRYDKDLLAVHCELVKGLHIVVEWTDDFSLVEGIYSPNTAYNYLLSPMNCQIRHGINFMMEFVNPAYSEDSVLYLSTKGNVALKTQLIGGDLLQENSDRLLSKYEIALFTSESVKGESVRTKAITNKILAIENGKANYYKTVTYTNEHGILEYAFMYSFKLGDKIESILVTKYGI